MRTTAALVACQVVGAIVLAAVAGYALLNGRSVTMSRVLQLQHWVQRSASIASARRQPTGTVPAPEKVVEIAEQNHVGPFDMILPVLREWGCGHANMETPRFITYGEGKGQFIVDVGLGTGASETLDAVRRGYVVFAMEPNPGNLAAIKTRVPGSGLAGRVQFIEPRRLGDGTWEMPKLAQPAPGGGYAFIIHAAADAEKGTAYLPASGGGGQLANIVNTGGSVPVAKMSIDAIVPDWAASLSLIKIDTQGWDYKVVRSADKLMKAGRVRYVQYEFSPALMMNQKSLDVGEPMELLRYVPSIGGICFDMMGNHNLFPQRGTGSSIEQYYRQLTADLDKWRDANGNIAVGPWDDIMCYFPSAKASRPAIDIESTGRGRHPGAGRRLVSTSNTFGTKEQEVQRDDRKQWASIRSVSEAHIEKRRRVLQSKSAQKERTPAAVNMILPVLREWGCGHANMETPRFITYGEGKGQFIVDVGLGTGASETLDAVRRGYVVFAMEPNPGNLAAIKTRVPGSGLAGRVQFIEPRRLGDGTWEMPKLAQPAPGGGYAFIIHAAADAEKGTAYLPASGGGGQLANIVNTGGSVPVAKMSIDAIVPDWAASLSLIKIDTQGWDYKVVRSADKLMKAGRVRYVQYEFSPALMMNQKSLDVGEPMELLRYVPSIGGICFDMMGNHNLFPQRGTGSSIEQYYRQLTADLDKWRDANGNIAVGPWDDIMCYFPSAKASRPAIDIESTGRGRHPYVATPPPPLEFTVLELSFGSCLLGLGCLAILLRLRLRLRQCFSLLPYL
jgi:FkbM family methyltransferase